MSTLEPDPRPDSKVEVLLSTLARQSGFEVESLWAISRGESLYQLSSIPAYAYNLNLEDIVSCSGRPDGALPRVTEVRERSGRQTLRLSLSQPAPETLVTRVLTALRERGALVEPFGAGCFGVAVRSLPELGWACEFIRTEDPAELIAFEPGFHPAEPFFDSSLPIDPSSV